MSTTPSDIGTDTIFTDLYGDLLLEEVNDLKTMALCIFLTLAPFTCILNVVAVELVRRDRKLFSSVKLGYISEHGSRAYESASYFTWGTLCVLNDSILINYTVLGRIVAVSYNTALSICLWGPLFSVLRVSAALFPAKIQNYNRSIFRFFLMFTVVTPILENIPFYFLVGSASLDPQGFLFHLSRAQESYPLLYHAYKNLILLLLFLVQFVSDILCVWLLRRVKVKYTRGKKRVHNVLSELMLVFKLFAENLIIIVALVISYGFRPENAREVVLKVTMGSLIVSLWQGSTTVLLMASRYYKSSQESNRKKPTQDTNILPTIQISDHTRRLIDKNQTDLETFDEIFAFCVFLTLAPLACLSHLVAVELVRREKTLFSAVKLGFICEHAARAYAAASYCLWGSLSCVLKDFPDLHEELPILCKATVVLFNTSVSIYCWGALMSMLRVAAVLFSSRIQHYDNILYHFYFSVIVILPIMENIPFIFIPDSTYMGYHFGLFLTNGEYSEYQESFRYYGMWAAYVLQFISDILCIILSRRLKKKYNGGQKSVNIFSYEVMLLLKLFTENVITISKFLVITYFLPETDEGSFYALTMPSFITSFFLGSTTVLMMAARRQKASAPVGVFFQRPKCLTNTVSTSG